MLMGTSEIYVAGEDVSLYVSPVKAFAGFEIRHSAKSPRESRKSRLCRIGTACKNILYLKTLIFFIKGQPLGSIGIQIEPVPILVLDEPVLYPVPAPKLIP